MTPLSPPSTDSEFPELLTVAEVAAVCRVSDEAVRHWVRKGQILREHVVYLPSGVLRIRRQAVEAILAAPEVTR